MNNAENNPTQSQQKALQANSPGLTPATATSRADPSTAEAELGRRSARPQPSPVVPQNDDRAPLPRIDLDGVTTESADPVQRAASHIVSVDNAAMEATGDTVDTDGKSLEAKRDLSLRHDNVITSGATLDNSVATPARGLGGFDSRPEGNLPRVAVRPGWSVVHRGRVEISIVTGGRMAHLFSLVQNVSKVL